MSERMVVTERETSPQPGQSPQPNLTPTKDGGSAEVDSGISPLPHTPSTEDRFSPGLGNGTDQEISECHTPQSPPTSIPFLHPFEECQTPPASTTPFPDTSTTGENEDQAYVSDEGDNSQQIKHDSETEKNEPSTIINGEGEQAVECTEYESVERSTVESKVEVTESCQRTVETQEATVETQEATVETQEATVETQEATVETQEAIVETQEASEIILDTIKEQIPLNQLWNIWSAEAPKIPDTVQKEDENIVETPSAGQSGENNEPETDKVLEEIINPPSSGDELNDAKLHLNDAQRRIHEMEIEIKRLENEREELSAAYREAETLRKQEEAKAQRLVAELAQVRHDYERRLSIKEEELDALRKQMQIEIEQLSQRVAEAEAKVKTEVARIKKKMQVQITELEMSLDVANKQNIDMQKTIKKLSMQITELQAHYDEIHRQLQQTVDQLGVSQRRGQALQAEVEELRVTLEQTARAKRVTEQQFEEAQTRLNELNTINVNLASARNKLEAEFSSLQSDYEEINKELRISDERYNRVVIELKSTKDILIEEQERVVKIESIKKSLEIEVHNLQVRIEEVETNALAGGKRVLSKLEARIRDMEIELEEEKRRHGETQKILRKKDHRVKELLVQTEEDHQNITMLNDSVDKLIEKVKMYKRQLHEQEGMSQQNLTRVRRFQRELEAAEDRADQAESNLSLIRAKHRSWVTTSQVPGGIRQVIVTEEQTSSSSQY